MLLLTFFGIWRALFRYAFRTDELVASVCGAGLAAGTVLALLLGKPHRYQTLYHAPTVVSHTMPLMIAGVILLAVLALHHRGRIWPAAATALLGGAVLGTFNEAFTGVCLVSVVAGLALWWLLPRHAIHWIVVVAGGVGLLLGFASVFLSPGSRNRQQLIHGGSLFSLHLIHQTLTAWVRVVSTAFTSGEGLLLFLVSAAVGVWLGAGLRRMGSRHSARFYVAALVLPALWALSASFGATFVLVYSFNGQLIGRERTWPSITVSLLLAASWYAVLLGQLAARRVASAEVIPRRRRLAVVGALVSLPALVLLGLGARVLVHDESALTDGDGGAQRRLGQATGGAPPADCRRGEVAGPVAVADRRALRALLPQHQVGLAGILCARLLRCRPGRASAQGTEVTTQRGVLRALWHGGRRGEWLRYAGVGLVNTASYYVIFRALHPFMPYLVAHAMAFAVCIVISFFLNCAVTFHVSPTWARFVRFPLSTLTTFIVMTVGVSVLVEGWAPTPTWRPWSAPSRQFRCPT